MPIPLALSCGLLLGLAFARVAEGLLLKAAGAPYTSPAFAIAGTFAWFVLGPIAGICAALSPDWTLCYLVDSQLTPAMLETVCVISAACSVIAGFFWGAVLVGRRHQNTLSRHLVIGGVLALALCIGLWKRLSTQATYAQYHGDFGLRPLAGTEFGYVILWMLMLLGIASTWTLLALFRLSQRAAHE